ncbi:hypothetical protein BH683_018915 [Williamsia sp. 1138]|uniref:Zinc ribbon domain-containing protein n=1 Tax=Gordonia rubripertincta TaxID=36822 RepID=A0ABT4MV61_GORRU|nr:MULTISPECIES: zinc ribbon domain-containing protein [Mycobacteriales]MCZ4549637.1 zinc ribbon domain-containing protein [Gordonia rubripertincta]OZG27470.1 hypothetical protein BH683_018915 [Williamsia sp. 1138]
MPTYQFRCPTCGDFDRRYPIASVPDHSRCVECDSSARRVMTAARLGGGSSVAMRLLDATARTASEPRVVSSPPSSGRPSPRPARAADPRLSTLPRP